MKKKIGLLCLALVVAFGTLGVGYSLWFEELFVQGTVLTGELNVDWSSGPVWDTEVDGKDFSHSEVIFEDLNGDGGPEMMWITIYNAYPCIWYHHEFDVHNAGTIPVHFTDWEIDMGTLPAGATLQIWEGSGPIADTQLHPGEQWFGCVELHLDNSAEENMQYTFGIRLFAHQYNENPGP